MSAYYNEIEPYAAAWLRNLIDVGWIAPGDVDERDIRDVRPDELRGYTQCHFFTGIGGWSYALRLAGWPDDRPVWTGSCPCQPFSSAGRRHGTTDERHLWPHWFWLIAQSRPPVVFGEQVAAAIKGGWLDLVFDDMEAEGYACGATVLPACSVGAPHIRQRLWFVADAGCGSAQSDRHDVDGATRSRSSEARQQRVRADTGASIDIGELADAERYASESGRTTEQSREGVAASCAGASTEPGRCGGSGDVANTDPPGRSEFGRDELLDGQRATQWHDADGCGEDGVVNASSKQRGLPRRARQSGSTGRVYTDTSGSTAPTGRPGFWSEVEWLPCIDARSRPVEPGTFPLAHGIPARVGKLRAYGNAIVPQVAAEFVRAYVGN